jgi:hypothetical protein
MPMPLVANDPAPSVWLCAAALADDSFEALLQAPAVGGADVVLVDAALPAPLIEALGRASRHVELIAGDADARDAATRRLVQLARDGWRVLRCFSAGDAAEAAFTGDALGRAGIRFGVIATGGPAPPRGPAVDPPPHPGATESWVGLAG